MKLFTAVLVKHKSDIVHSGLAEVIRAKVFMMGDSSEPPQILHYDESVYVRLVGDHAVHLTQPAVDDAVYYSLPSGVGTVRPVYSTVEGEQPKYTGSAWSL